MCSFSWFLRCLFASSMSARMRSAACSRAVCAGFSGEIASSSRSALVVAATVPISVAPTMDGARASMLAAGVFRWLALLLPPPSVSLHFTTSSEVCMKLQTAITRPWPRLSYTVHPNSAHNSRGAKLGTATMASLSPAAAQQGVSTQNSFCQLATHVHVSPMLSWEFSTTTWSQCARRPHVRSLGCESPCMQHPTLCC